MTTHPTPTIQSLYPHLNEKELAEAEDNLERYLALVLRIYERIEADPDQLTVDNGTLDCTPPEPEPSG